MHQEQAHTIFVSKLLHPAHDVIIVGIAVSIGADLADFLQGVDDNEPGIGMLPDEPFKLLIKSCAELLCIYCKMEVIRSLYAEHTGHTLLQSLIIILQRKVKNRTLVDFIIPERLSGADVIGKLRHEKRLTYLWRTGKQIGAGVEQTVYDGRPALIYRFVQFVHRYRVQIRRVAHSLHLPQNIFKVFRRIFVRVIDFRVQSGYTTDSVLNGLPFICANRCAKGSLFFCFIHSHPLLSVPAW